MSAVEPVLILDIIHLNERSRGVHFCEKGCALLHDSLRMQAAALPDTKKIADMQIGRSVGAKSRNYEVIDKEMGIVCNFLERTHLQDSEVFAGKGVRKPLRSEVAQGLADEFCGKLSDWQHAKDEVAR